MYIQDLFNPNQKKKLKGNKLIDNSKNLNSVGRAVRNKPNHFLVYRLPALTKNFLVTLVSNSF